MGIVTRGGKGGEGGWLPAFKKKKGSNVMNEKKGKLQEDETKLQDKYLAKGQYRQFFFCKCLFVEGKPGN